MFRRIFVGLLIMTGLMVIQPVFAQGAAKAPRTQSRSVMVFDATAGTPVYSKNVNSIHPTASIAKVMMAMVVLDSHRPMNSTLRVSSADRDTIKNTGSRLPIGSRMTRATLLHIALMSSENRAAAALSRYYPGGRPAFLRAMNRKAAGYGMRHTHFADPAGLSPRTRSTAYDLMVMLKHAGQYPVIRRYSTDHQATVATGLGGQLLYRNSNALIRKSGWDFVMQKTGFTNEAGHNLALYVLINHRRYIIILTGARSPYGPYADAIHLKDWLEARRS